MNSPSPRPITPTTATFKDKYYERLASIRHQGSIIVFAQAKNSKNDADSKLYYNVLSMDKQQESKDNEVDQNNHTDNASDIDSVKQVWNEAQYWQDFQEVKYPNELRFGGMELITFPKVVSEVSDYWQCLSDGTYVYLFRSISGHIYANKYILVKKGTNNEYEEDSSNMMLKLSTESRYRLSGKKYTPLHEKDIISYQDLNGNLFIEPTLELTTITHFFDDYSDKNFFTVCLTPSHIPGLQRWQFFTQTLFNGTPQIKSISILRDQNGWFDLTDGKTHEFIPIYNDLPIELQKQPAVSLFYPQETPIEVGIGNTEDVKRYCPKKIQAAPRIIFAGVFDIDGQGTEKMATLDFQLDTEGAGTPIFPLDDSAIIRIPKASMVNHSLFFEENNSYISCAFISPIFRSGFTVEMWIKPEWLPSQGQKNLYSISFTQPHNPNNTADEVLQCSISSDYKTVSVSYPSSLYKQDFPITSANLNPYRWNHIAFSFTTTTTTDNNTGITNNAPHSSTNANISLYINGKLISTKESVNFRQFANTMAKEINIGSMVGSSFQGGVSEIRIWNAARTETEIQNNMYKERDNVTNLIISWKLNEGKGNKITSTIGAGVNGTIQGEGAKWSLDAPPLDPLGSSQAWNKLSRGLGVIDELDSPAIPTLLNSADGLFRLYCSDGNKQLSVFQYDSTSIRAHYYLPWSAGTTDKGKLLLIAKQMGINMNEVDIKIDHEINDPEEKDLVKLTIKGKNQQEIWRDVPREISTFAKILNGKASNDPRNIEVQNGSKPFYDYLGEFAITRFPTTDKNHFLITSKYSPGMFLGGAEINPVENNSSLCNLTLKLNVYLADFFPDYQLTPNNEQPSPNPDLINRTSLSLRQRFKTWINFQNVPRDLNRIIDVISGKNQTSYDYNNNVSLEGNANQDLKYTICKFQVGTQPLLFIFFNDTPSGAITVNKVSIQDGIIPGTCNVQIYPEDTSNKDQIFYFNNVSRDPLTFIRTLNGAKLPEYYSYENNAFIKNNSNQVISPFTVLGEDFTQTIPIGTEATVTSLRLDSPVDKEVLALLMAQYTLIANGASGDISMNESNSTIKLKPYINNKPSDNSIDYYDWRRGSRLIAACNPRLPINAFPGLLDVPELTENNSQTPQKAQLWIEAREGGWASEGAKVAYSFKEIDFSSFTGSSPSQDTELFRIQDRTVEAWVSMEKQTTPSYDSPIYTSFNENGNLVLYLGYSISTDSTNVIVRDGLRSYSFAVYNPEPFYNQWHHIAAISSNNYKLSFDKYRKAICKNAQALNPEESFSLDGIIECYSQNNILQPISKPNHILSKTNGNQKFSYKLSLVPSASGSNQTNCKLEFQISFEQSVSNDSNGSYYKKANTYILTSENVDAPKLYFAVGCSMKKENKLDLFFNIKPLNSNAQTIKFQVEVIDANGEKSPLDSNIENSCTIDDIPSSYRITDTVKGPFVIGYQENSPPELGVFKGSIGMLRYWDRVIKNEVDKLFERFILPDDINPPVADWHMDKGIGISVLDHQGTSNLSLTNNDMWTQSNLTSIYHIFINGEKQPPTNSIFHSTSNSPGRANRGKIFVGTTYLGPTTYTNTNGALSEVRVWDHVRTEEEIFDMRFSRLTGEEDGLLAYWPISSGSGKWLKSYGSSKCDIPISPNGWINYTSLGDKAPPVGNEIPAIKNGYGQGATAWWAKGKTGLTALEYGEIQADADGLFDGVLKRFYAYIEPDDNSNVNSCKFITGFKVGDLDIEYLGQVQTHPELHGYIEGAPPIPGENLTRPYWKSKFVPAYQAYVGATSVQIQEPQNTTITYQASKSSSFNTNLHSQLGLAIKKDILFFETEGKIVYQIDNSHSSQSHYSAQNNDHKVKNINNELAAAGNWEASISQPQEGTLYAQLGRRYLLDNVGYALLKSRTANLYAMRLRQTQSSIGFHILPDPDIPEDFNIVIFPMNSAYTKQGTLDGKVAFTNDPDYPNAHQKRGSYFKAKEVSNLINSIENEEKNLLSYYKNFNNSSSPNLDSKSRVDYGSEDREEWIQNRTKRNLVNTYVWTAAGGFYAEEEQVMFSREESCGGTYDHLTSHGPAMELKGIVGLAGLGFYAAGHLLFGHGIHTEVSKGKNESNGFGLSVQVRTEDFLEKFDTETGDFDGKNTPGKVSAYRFKTFYLAPKKSHFDTFFDTVVDKNWLETDISPEASILREAQSRTNNIWRVMHRVTFVKRIPPDLQKAPIEEKAEPTFPVLNIVGNNTLIEKVIEEIDMLQNQTMGQLKESTVFNFPQGLRQLISEYQTEVSDESGKLNDILSGIFNKMDLDNRLITLKRNLDRLSSRLMNCDLSKMEINLTYFQQTWSEFETIDIQTSSPILTQKNKTDINSIIENLKNIISKIHAYDLDSYFTQEAVSKVLDALADSNPHWKECQQESAETGSSNENLLIHGAIDAYIASLLG